VAPRITGSIANGFPSLRVFEGEWHKKVKGVNETKY
jgi:hypothetical protein